MKKIAFFDTKPYDEYSFKRYNTNYDITFFEENLNEKTVELATGYDGVVVFVNDTLNKQTLDKLYEMNIKIIALRCAGYNNVDVKSAYKRIHIARVPAYSPYAVAEHAMALLLSLNRKIHKAYNRTRDFNFSLNGLAGFDMYGKTIGVIGTGKIGQVFIDICKGFGMNILAYDLFPNPNLDINYVPLDDLLKQSDMISIHCPLTDKTKHLINKDSIKKMKDGVYIINTSRGGIIESNDLLQALQEGKIKGAGLDVYEEESDIFFEDMSDTIIKDNILTLLLSLPNVIITSHQAFLTEEALSKIAEVTLNNLDQYFNNQTLENEVCYLCKDGPSSANCFKNKNKRCF
jgi:D-lactate dehydrogenase